MPLVMPPPWWQAREQLRAAGVKGPLPEPPRRRSCSRLPGAPVGPKTPTGEQGGDGNQSQRGLAILAEGSESRMGPAAASRKTSPVPTLQPAPPFQGSRRVGVSRHPSPSRDERAAALERMAEAARRLQDALISLERSSAEALAARQAEWSAAEDAAVGLAVRDSQSLAGLGNTDARAAEAALSFA
jgi:hypothetical protein